MERVAEWAVESGYDPKASTTKDSDSGSPASLLVDSQGRLANSAAVCVSQEHAEATSRLTEWLRADPRRYYKTPKAFHEMRLRDTIRRRAEPGRG